MRKATGISTNILAKMGGEREPAGPQAAVPTCFLLFVADVLEEICDGPVGVIYPDQGGLDGLFGLEGLVHQDRMERKSK